MIVRFMHLSLKKVGDIVDYDLFCKKLNYE